MSPVSQKHGAGMTPEHNLSQAPPFSHLSKMYTLHSCLTLTHVFLGVDISLALGLFKAQKNRALARTP